MTGLYRKLFLKPKFALHPCCGISESHLGVHAQTDALEIPKYDLASVEEAQAEAEGHRMTVCCTAVAVGSGPRKQTLGCYSF